MKIITAYNNRFERTLPNRYPSRLLLLQLVPFSAVRARLGSRAPPVRLPVSQP